MRTFRYIAAALVFVFGSLSYSQQASAQANACVSLLVGAGYAAKMRVVAGSFHTDWSSSFPIGKTVCQSLKGVGDGVKFSVEVSAVLGETKTCTPSNIARVAASPSNVVFQAWGTTLNVKCEEPSGEADAERDAATMNVSAEGKKAAESADKK